ncbi:MAG: tetratricopeptide repeat protein [Ignavibacteriaceae bacterium]
MFKLSRKFFLSTLFLFIVLVRIGFAQTQEIDAIKKAAGLKNASQKINAMKLFIKDYPESNYSGIAKANIFSAYLDLGKVDSALYFVNQYFEIIPPEMRMNPYNEVAYTLAQKKVGLDSADIYSKRAVELARNNNPQNLSMYLDTRALVLFDLGKFDSAYTLEKQAIIGHENDPAYLLNLAAFEEAAGKKLEAINTAAQAIINGDNDQALTRFNKWVSETKTTNDDQDKLKNEVAALTLKKYFEENSTKDKITTNSNAGVFLAKLGANFPQAEKWTKEGVSSLNKNSSIDDIILFKKNLGIVYSAENKLEPALAVLKSIEEFDDPWDFDFWYALGNTYVKLRQNKNALNAYISGIIGFENQRISKAATALAQKEGIDKQGLQDMIEKQKEDLAAFVPGHFDKKTSGKVVLAELFTGAECNPCAAADYAFDALSNYYPKTDLAILEYHVHIPGPDPLTNPQTFQRYKYYGGNFGTPTVFFDGTERITGGGPRFLLKNRFNVYNYDITKLLNEKPGLQISGNSSINDKIVSVNLNVKGKPIKDMSLHLALVEKSIDYMGGNGVDKQIFVVRDLIGSGDGIDLTRNDNSENFKEVFDLNKIQEGLTKYLSNPTKDPSWRPNVRFNGWRAKTDKINTNNLAVVAWVQNNITKKILQSLFIDVPAQTLKEISK